MNPGFITLGFTPFCWNTRNQLVSLVSKCGQSLGCQEKVQFNFRDSYCMMRESCSAGVLHYSVHVVSRRMVGSTCSARVVLCNLFVYYHMACASRSLSVALCVLEAV